MTPQNMPTQAPSILRAGLTLRDDLSRSLQDEKAELWDLAWVDETN